MTQAEIKSKIEDLKKKASNKSLPASAVDKLNSMIADLESKLEKEESKEEAKEESKEEKSEAKAEKKKKLKKDGTPDRKLGKVSKIDVAVDKQTVTYKGKTYTLDECEDLFKAWNMKKKAARQATEKSEAKSVTDKVLDKAETTIKQVLTDKSAKKKIEQDPKTAKKELGQIEMNMRRFLQSVEKFLGKRIPESKVKRIFAFFDEIELMEMGGALSYADVYDGRSAEFRDGGSMENIIDEVRENGEFMDSYIIDESQTVSNAGEQESWLYNGKNYIITVWNHRAVEHQDGEQEIEIVEEYDFPTRKKYS